MDCAGLFLLLVLLPVIQTSSLDCSDQGSASGMADHQQVTTLQYCMVDNCTIMMVDNGEILDIIYTTDNLLVTTTRGNQTSLVIAKDEVKLWCVTTEGQRVNAVLVAMSFVIVITSGYIVVVHLLYKELRHTVGKLLMIRSVVMVAYYAANMMIAILSSVTALKSCLICRTLTHITLQTVMIQEACSTCILAHITCALHHSDNCRHEMPKHLFKYYIAYLLGTVVVFYVIAIAYDVVTNDDNHLMSPSGHCVFARPATYNIMYVMIAYATLNKAAQISLWVIYLFYCCKFTKDGVYHKREIQRHFSKVIITIGATVGISQMIWLFVTLFGYMVLKISAEMLSVAVQQCVIMAIFIFNKKAVDLCKAKLFQ